MPFNIQPSNELLKPAEDMGFGLELRKISSKWQSSSKTDKESSVLPQSNRSSKDADKLKSKNGIGRPPRCDPSQKAKQDADGKIQSRESLKKSATESDELVKHMSNLPGYLLCNDRGEHFQEKALNFGVLDWSRLEKWKHKHKHTPVLATNFTSFHGSESSSRTASKSSTIIGGNEKLDDRKGLLSSGSGIMPLYKECSESAKRFQCPKTETKSIIDDQRMTPLAIESFGKTHSHRSLEKKRRNDHDKTTSRVGNCASMPRHHGASDVGNENANGRDDEAKQRTEGLQEYNLKKKERNHNSGSDMGLPSVKSKDKGVSFSSKKKMSSGSSETMKKVDPLPEPDLDIGHKHCQSKASNIVLLCPGEISQSSSFGDFQLPRRTSSDEDHSESSKSSLSYVSLPEEVNTEDLCSEIPRSSALHSGVELASSSETTQHSISTDLDIDHSSVLSETPACSNKMSSMLSERACFEKDVLGIHLRNQCGFSSLKESLDQETAELTGQRGMNPSRYRRFSFSLSRIGRSFSFKEGPSIPQFSPMYVGAKSGPVTPASSARLDNSSKEKANSHSHIRNRSSPLRRLFDPILKHKASSGIHHSTESSHTQKGSTNSSSFSTISVSESLHAEKTTRSSTQALLQLTIKNGIPFFKFVLDNESKIFAATMKSLGSLEKDDLGCYFTFYLVNEIKRKTGGWISHRNKEKGCGYAYNVVGQMKFSSSKITEPINQNFKRQYMVKEYVLSGVEIGQTDQGPPKFIQSRELAAAVIEVPYENLSHEGLHSDNNLLQKGCLECLAEERCLCSPGGENDTNGSTIVILPGDVHGSPSRGEPSPLIYRWKTGGSCDCGGWDIGCKLRVLSNQKQSTNIPKSSKPYPDQFQLFVQEGAERNTPLFTLSPLKDGFYSVEFNSTITHLQAFFISVAVLSCQELPSSLEMNSMHEEILKEPSSKNTNRFQGKAPVKYTPIPPLSPFGRV